MGVFKMFSSSSADKKSRSIFSRSSDSVFAEKMRVESITKNPNPRPDNYKIQRSKVVGNFLIIDIQYPDCTNYEGRKILVFEGCTLQDLKKQKLIDPHFSENKRFISPVARLEPTKKGWMYAESFALIN